jgi:hypothetical protein
MNDESNIHFQNAHSSVSLQHVGVLSAISGHPDFESKDRHENQHDFHHFV